MSWYPFGIQKCDMRFYVVEEDINLVPKNITFNGNCQNLIHVTDKNIAFFIWHAFIGKSTLVKPSVVSLYLHHHSRTQTRRNVQLPRDGILQAGQRGGQSSRNSGWDISLQTIVSEYIVPISTNFTLLIDQVSHLKQSIWLNIFFSQPINCIFLWWLFWHGYPG